MKWHVADVAAVEGGHEAVCSSTIHGHDDRDGIEASTAT